MRKKYLKENGNKKTITNFSCCFFFSLIVCILFVFLGEEILLVKNNLNLLIDENERKKYRVSFNEKGEEAAKIELKANAFLILLLRILESGFTSKKKHHLTAIFDFNL